MSFDLKNWSNPVTMDAQNLNRIEQGIKTLHDTLEITNEELHNLQNKNSQITADLKILNESQDTLKILSDINSLLSNGDLVSLLTNTNNFLTKQKQSLSPLELEQVYKNLHLNSFIKLTSLTVNGVNIVEGTQANIEIPKIDNALNISSTNPISNTAITKALKNLSIPTSISELLQDKDHQTVTAAEKQKWNSINTDNNTSGIVNETDPTVPEWAKQKNKPTYNYTEIIGTPDPITNNKNLINGAGYLTETTSQQLIDKSLNSFTSSTIKPINNTISIISSNIENLSLSINDKAEREHIHNEYALSDHEHDKYALKDHTHDYTSIINSSKSYTDTVIKNLIGAAPDTMDTLEELSTAIKNNKELIDVLGDTYSLKSEIEPLVFFSKFYSQTTMANNENIFTGKIHKSGQPLSNYYFTKGNYSDHIRIDLSLQKLNVDSINTESNTITITPISETTASQDIIRLYKSLNDTTKTATNGAITPYCITNLLSTYVDLSSEQTVTGTKTFNEIHATTIYLD